jgi:hypothetical protein
MADAIKVHVYDDAALLGTVNVSSGNWSKTGQSLAAGVHKIKGKAEDLAGNIGAFSAIKNIRTGTIETPGCDLLDDSGESSSDKVTNDNTPRIEVILSLDPISGVDSLSQNTVKKLKLKKWNDSAYVNFLEATTGFTFEDNNTVISYIFQLTDPLDDGEHKFEATWVDQKDNESALGAELSITVDTTAPNAPAITNIQDGQVFIGTSIDISGTAT